MLKQNGLQCRTYFAVFIQVVIFFLSINILGQTKKTNKNDYSTIVELRVENDFVFQTDVYFTQGLLLKVFAPFANKNPLNALLLPYSQDAKVYHGISIIQNLFTPVQKSDSIIVADRPFAAYLLLQSTRISLYKKKREKITSVLKIGWIGSPAFGEEMQNGIHSLLPTSPQISGWQHQIKTDLMLNYSAQFEKGIIHSLYLDFNISVSGNVGVPYTNIGSGIHLRIGKFINYFANLELSKRNKWQYYFSLSSNLKYVVYDATLQGGLFNKKSVHTIAAENINRFIARADIFGNLSFNNFKVEAGIVLITREFKTGLSHKWGVLSLFLGF